MLRRNKFTIIQYALAALYFSTLLYIVFFSRRRRGLVWHDDYVNLVPIRSTIWAYHSIPLLGKWEFYSNLIGNILLFVPFSFVLIVLFRVSSKIKIIVLGACTSIAIESAQYYWRIGIPDIDDVLLNTLGTALGVALWALACKLLVVAKKRIIRRHSVAQTQKYPGEINT